MTTIYIGTTNKGKIKEYLELTKGDLFVGYDFVVAPEMEVDEPFSTFEENAEHKAKAYSEALGEFVISEDTGLVIPDLNDFPGVFSGRVAEKLLGKEAAEEVMKLKGYPSISRLNCEMIFNLVNKFSFRKKPVECYYKAIIALSDKNGGIIKTFQGICCGNISVEPKGLNGFGYDALFVPEFGNGKTFGETSSEEKNKYSHRAIACQYLGAFLKHVDIDQLATYNE